MGVCYIYVCMNKCVCNLSEQEGLCVCVFVCVCVCERICGKNLHMDECLCVH